MHIIIKGVFDTQPGAMRVNRPPMELSQPAQQSQFTLRQKQPDFERPTVPEVKPQSSKRRVNFIRGWPCPSILPAPLLSAAMFKVLAAPSTLVPALEYGPEQGYYPLRDSMSQWLSRHYSIRADPDRLCITGGASQSLQSILASYTDPVITKSIWMGAPCYHHACAVFEDAGFTDRLRAIREDDDGIDVDLLEKRLKEFEKGEENQPQQPPQQVSQQLDSQNQTIRSGY
jgi:DNA-binding transcriptional MocR family regulator